MREVAERLVLAVATTTEGHAGAGCEHIALRVAHLDLAAHEKWPVGPRDDRGLLGGLLPGAVVEPFVGQCSRWASLYRLCDLVCGCRIDIDPGPQFVVEDLGKRPEADSGVDAPVRVPMHPNLICLVRPLRHGCPSLLDNQHRTAYEETPKRLTVNRYTPSPSG